MYLKKVPGKKCNYDDNMTYYRCPKSPSCLYCVCHAAYAGEATRVPRAKSKGARVPFLRKAAAAGSQRGSGQGKIRQGRSVSRMWVTFLHELRSRPPAAA